MDPISPIALGSSRAVGRLDELGSSLAPAAPASPAGGASFANALESAVGSLLDAQKGAEKATLELAAGRTEDLHEVMLAVNQAGLAMQLALEVRNRLVDAYHEVMRMTV